MIAILAKQCFEASPTLWSKLSIATQLSLVAGLSLGVWMLTLFVNPRPLAEQPTAFVGYLGFLTGILIAAPLEERFVGYSPKAVSIPIKIARFILMLALLVGSLIVLDELFALIATEGSLQGFALRFIRYAIVGAGGIFCSAWLFDRFGWINKRKVGDV